MTIRNFSILPIFLYIFLSITSIQQVNGQTAPAKEWDKVFGGDNDDMLSIVTPTKDGNYLLGGSSLSNVSGDKSEAPRNSSTPIYKDYWVIKMTPDGTKLWDRTFGGNGVDELESIVSTPDGGFLLAGSSWSGISGDKTEASRGSYDYWVIRIDANGNKLWDKTFGGNGNDYLRTAIATTDGSFLLGGFSGSGIFGDKTTPNRGDMDYWLVKISASGISIWDKTIGGKYDDVMESIVVTNEGDLLLCGYSWSPASLDKTAVSFGGTRDYWVVKTDASGTTLWDKSYGSVAIEQLYAAIKVPSGGCLLAGVSGYGASGNKTSAGNGGDDFWIVKIDDEGNILWDRSFGGSIDDQLRALIATKDGGFLLGGNSRSAVGGDHSQANVGAEDYWVVKCDGSGTKQWDKNIGGSGLDYLTGLSNTVDGGFLLCGYRSSVLSGADSTVQYISYNDYWIVKLMQPNNISVGSLASTDFCAGNVVTIGYTATGSYSESNVFTAQLSDASGSFRTPVSIGSVTSAALSGTINVTIPTGIPAGTDYRMRVIATNNATIGSEYGTNLTVRTAPVVILKDTAICQAGTLSLNAPVIVGADYAWTGPGGFTASSATINIGNVTNVHGGTYTVTVTANGCATVRPVNVIVNPLPLATTGNDQLICSAGTITIGTAAMSNNKYSWSSNPTGFSSTSANPQINPVATTTYTLTETTVAGCSKTNSVTITVSARPAIPSITATGNVLTSSTATGNQWYLNGAAISGATSQMHTAQVSGNYTVQVTQNSCSSISPTFAFVVTALVDLQNWNGEVKLFPNPVQKTLFIRNEKLRVLQWQLFDLTGRMRAEGSMSFSVGAIDMASCAPGIYQVRITDIRKKEVVSFVISKL